MKEHIDEQFAELNTRGQNQYWTELHQYALAQTKHMGRRAPMVMADYVDDSVRRPLELLDAHIADHTSEFSDQERTQFWEALHQ